MEDIQEEEQKPRTSLAERFRVLEEKVKLKDREEETKEKTKFFKWPWKWRRKFNASKKKKNNELVLVIFLNKKNRIEGPKFMPIFDGNMVVWRNKPYEFDPRAIWTIEDVRGSPQVYLIKEIDRRPVKNKYGKYVYRDASVSNMDLDEIRERGDSTESDEFLIKAALKAQTVQANKKMMSAIGIVLLIAIVGGVIWFLMKGGGSAAGA